MRPSNGVITESQFINMCFQVLVVSSNQARWTLNYEKEYPGCPLPALLRVSKDDAASCANALLDWAIEKASSEKLYQDMVTRNVFFGFIQEEIMKDVLEFKKKTRHYARAIELLNKRQSFAKTLLNRMRHISKRWQTEKGQSDFAKLVNTFVLGESQLRWNKFLKRCGMSPYNESNFGGRELTSGGVEPMIDSITGLGNHGTKRNGGLMPYLYGAAENKPNVRNLQTLLDPALSLGEKAARLDISKKSVLNLIRECEQPVPPSDWSGQDEEEARHWWLQGRLTKLRMHSWKKRLAQAPPATPALLEAIFPKRAAPNTLSNESEHLLAKVPEARVKPL